MTTGEKIKRIRIFRDMTQKELGVLAGLGEPNANIRIAQYECDARIPRAKLLDKFAQVLKVNPLNFHSPVPGSAEDVIQTLFWMEEEIPGSICLTQLVGTTGKTNSPPNIVFQRNDSDEQAAEATTGLYFQNNVMNNYLREWLFRQQELRSGKITRDEYFEWKINWPNTSRII